MQDFTLVVRPCALPGYTRYAATDTPAHCTIKWVDGRLSITGVIGAKRNGDCLGSCGQINGTLREHESKGEVRLADGWTAETFSEFLRIWDTHHLNDMVAGSPAQTDELRKHTFPGYPLNHFEWAQAVLKDAGLQPDASYLHNGKPYAYGTAWLRREVPEDALAFLASLPPADVACAWRNP